MSLLLILNRFDIILVFPLLSLNKQMPAGLSNHLRGYKIVAPARMWGLYLLFLIRLFLTNLRSVFGSYT